MKNFILLAAVLTLSNAWAGPVTEYRCHPLFRFFAIVDGGHPVRVIHTPGLNLAEKLPELLPAFGKNDPNQKVGWKKKLFFSDPVTNFVHWALTSGKNTVVDGHDFYNRMEPGVKYNFVLEEDGAGGAAMIIGRVEVKYKRLDDLLSKHLILSKRFLIEGEGGQKAPRVRYAGEFEKKSDGTIVLTNNSGTFQPDGAYNQQAEDAIRYMLNDPRIPIRGEVVDPVALKAAAEAKKQAEKEAKAKKASSPFLQKLKGFDSSYPRQMALKWLIGQTTTNRKLIRVPISQLLNLHPMNGVNEDKIEGRAQALRSEGDAIIASGVLDLETQNRLVPSKAPMSVVLDDQGRYILFDGNGRQKAIEKAFLDNPDLLVDVELYETPSPTVKDWIARIRKARGFEN